LTYSQSGVWDGISQTPALEKIIWNAASTLHISINSLPSPVFASSLLLHHFYFPIDFKSTKTTPTPTTTTKTKTNERTNGNLPLSAFCSSFIYHHLLFALILSVFLIDRLWRCRR
jgi:hypothetical protein